VRGGHSYCEHGGVCELPDGHDGLHDSGYCQWSDDEALTKDAADAILIAKEWEWLARLT
jgi:hypothetical protein